MPNFAYSFVPVVAVFFGALFALWRRPGPVAESALQHLAAGVVFAAAAVEILPQVKHDASVTTTLIGGGLGIVAMMAVKSLEGRWHGPVAMTVAVGVDVFVDGLVLGLAFLAGERAGMLLTAALTLEILFLGVTVSNELSDSVRSRARVVMIATALALLLPLGTAVATPVAHLPPEVIGGFLTFGLMALLYLVTEELLVEAHDKPDSPYISSLFFIGFLGLLVVEKILAAG